MNRLHKMIQQIITTTLFVSILFSCGQNDSSKESKEVILFVCEHGAARSPIAAAYFNKIAEEQNLNYRAVFRGTDPNDSLTPGTSRGLEDDSLNINGWTPKMVSENDIKEAYKVVTFDLTLPSTSPTSLPLEEWNGTPPISKDYDIARDIIVEKVNKLIETLPRTEKE